MAFARFNGLAQDDEGNALDNVTIEVRNENTGFLATIYSDVNGNNQLSNPFVSADPNFFFHAVGGSYRITASKGALSRTWRWEPVGTAQAVDVEDLLVSIQAGIIPALTKAELDTLAPGDVENPTATAGVVYADPTPSLNGYYVYDYGEEEWVWARPLPDTLASLTLQSTSGNQLNMQSDPAISPSAVRAYIVDVDDWENTGPVTVSIDGGDPISAYDVNGAQFPAGVFTGRLFLSNEVSSLRMIVGGDVIAAVAATLQNANDARDARDLSQAWAAGTEPGGPGTKSAREWAEDSAQGVEDVAEAIDQFALSAIPVGMVTMQNGAVDPGHLRFGEGGTYDRTTYPDLAAWMDANGEVAFGLTPTQIANGEFPDWRDYSPRTAGGLLGPAVGETQEDAMQRILGGFYLNQLQNDIQWSTELADLEGGPSGAFTGLVIPSKTRAGQNSGQNGDQTQKRELRFDSGDSPGASVSDDETRVKSFGVRWQIKAYGVLTEPGTLDLVALEQNVQTLTNEAVRGDVDQTEKDDAWRERVWANIRTGWIQVGKQVATSDVAAIDFTELGAFRALRATMQLNPVNNGVIPGFMFSPDNGETWTVTTTNGSGFRHTATSGAYHGNIQAGRGSITSAGVSNNPDYPGASAVLNLFEFNQEARSKWTTHTFYLIGTNYCEDIMSGNVVDGCSNALRFLFSAGLIAAGSWIELEGML